MSAQSVTMTVAVTAVSVIVVVHRPILTGVNQLAQPRFSNALQRSRSKSIVYHQPPRHTTATNLPPETQLTPLPAPPTMASVLLKLPLGGVLTGDVRFAQP